MKVVAAVDRPAVERRYFVRAAVAIAAIVVAGFVPNYTLRLLHHDRYLTWTVHLHGLLLASWIGLFVVQARLVASRRIELHRRLGILGAALVAPILIVGLAVLLNAVVQRAPAADLAPTRVNYCRLSVAFDGLNLLLFGGLTTYAILVRRQHRWHPVFIWGTALLVAADVLTYVAKVSL